MLQRVAWRRKKERFWYQALTKQQERETWKTYIYLVLISHGSHWMKNLLQINIVWNIYSGTETEEIWKGNFEFCSFVSSSSNVYYRALPFICMVCTNVWLSKFGSYSVATQQVNRIVPDMCVRWQWLPETACQYEAICSCQQSV